MAEELYRETQRAPHRRVPVVLGVVVLGSLASALLGGAEPAFTIALGLFVAVLAVLAVARLTVVVRSDGVHVRLFPVHLRVRHVPAWRVRSVETVEEGLVGRFGGRGLRWHPGRGWAYILRGSGGVRLDRTGAADLSISSERPAELAAAVGAAMDADA